MIIVFSHTKGGVGKTTSAIGFASALADAGFGVRVLDADPQASALTWARIATEAGDPLSFDVIPVTAKRIDGYRPVTDVTIIDCPPGRATTIDAAIRRADVVVIPTSPGPADIDRVFATLEVVPAEKAVVLLTQARLQTRLYRDVRELFAEQGVPVLETTIPLREGIRSSFGACLKEFFGYDEAAAEVLKMYGDIT
ncbi:AAA family ATPase [Corynebacterium sp. CCM 9203]|uniref:AAA family ATPase n=1 Tax=Corynebacterium sp. CCM 9203 TaxID=3057615 RepID=UPI0035246807